MLRRGAFARSVHSHGDGWYTQHLRFFSHWDRESRRNKIKESLLAFYGKFLHIVARKRYDDLPYEAEEHQDTSENEYADIDTR